MDPVDMIWYVWEAHCMEINMMNDYGMVTTGVMVEMNAISSETRAQGQFTMSLRKRACDLVNSLNVDDLKLAYKLRNEDYERLGA